MSGNGGSQGTVRYAPYLEDLHWSFVSGSLATPFITTNYALAHNTAWAATPYSGLTYTDPATQEAEINTRWGALNTLITGLNDETEWNAKLTKAVAAIDVAGVLKDIDVNALATAARAGGVSVSSAVDGLLSLSPIDANAISSNAHTQAAAAKGAVVGAYLDWNAAVDAVVAKLAIASPDIDIAGTISAHFTNVTPTDLFTLVEGRIASLISTVITNAFAAVNPTLLQNLANTFVAQRANDRARTRTRYKANAVTRGGSQSSAYALGLALLDSDFSQDTTNFQVQANLQLYSQGIETYNSLLQGYLGTTAQVEVANRAEKTRFAGAAVTANKELKNQFLTTNALEKMSNDVQRKQVDVGVYVEAFRAELTNRLQAQLGDKQADVQKGMARINAYVEAFRQELIIRGSVESQEKQIRDGMIDNAVNNMLTYRQFIISANDQVTSLRGELTRLNYVMDSEYIGNALDRNINSATYQLSLLSKGVPILGALGGGTALPDRHNKVASALGGALTGAGSGAIMGAKIAAAGGPITAAGGAALGAALGGLAGLLG